VDVIQRKKVRKALGDFCQAAVYTRTRRQSLQTKVQKTALLEAVGAQGGFLLPTDILYGVDAQLMERSLFHQLAFNIQMDAPQVQIPAVDITAAHATGASPLLGGLAVQWQVPEGTSVPESEPSFVGVSLKKADLIANVVVSNQMVWDGGEALGSYLETVFARAITWAVERACFTGTGVAQPLGILNAKATLLVTRGTGGTIVQNDLGNMMGALLPACYAGAVWACSVTALQKMEGLVTYVSNPSIHDHALAGSLFNRPLFVTENLPAVGTTGDLILFDPGMYILGTGELLIDVSTHVKLLSNQTVFRLWWRGNGQPIPSGTCTLADGVTPAGCFVALN
jgi:HK97 family phage major capsid protein